jgi:hypothetical protein
MQVIYIINCSLNIKLDSAVILCYYMVMASVFGVEHGGGISGKVKNWNGKMVLALRPASQSFTSFDSYFIYVSYNISTATH